MNTLTFLGICSNQTEKYDTVSFLCEFHEKTILVDCGPGTVKQLYKLKKSISEIDIIILTHIHGDHFLGFPYYLFSLYTELKLGKTRNNPVSIIASKETIDSIYEILRLIKYPSLDKFPFPFDLKIVELGEANNFNFNDFHIDALSVEHSVPTFGIKISDNNKSIAYSSDSIFCENIVTLGSNVDILIHEAMGLVDKNNGKSKHGYVQDAIQSALKANPNKMYLVHLFPDIVDQPEKLIDEVTRQLDIEVLVPKELQRIEI